MTQTSALTLCFAEIGLGDVPSVGGKGASLGELTRAGIRVPQGFVVTTDAFNRFVAAIDPAGEMRGAIESLTAGDLLAISRVCEGVRARIVGEPMPQELQAAILAGYAELCGAAGDQPVAVRSSATSETAGSDSIAFGLGSPAVTVTPPRRVIA